MDNEMFGLFLLDTLTQYLPVDRNHLGIGYFAGKKIVLEFCSKYNYNYHRGMAVLLDYLLAGSPAN